MGARRMGIFLRKSGGIILGGGGAILVHRKLPLYLRPLLLGGLLHWVGWRAFLFGRYLCEKVEHALVFLTLWRCPR